MRCKTFNIGNRRPVSGELLEQPSLRQYGIRAAQRGRRFDLRTKRNYGITDVIICDCTDQDIQALLPPIWNQPIPLKDLQFGSSPTRIHLVYQNTLIRLALVWKEECYGKTNWASLRSWVNTHCRNGVILLGDRHMLDHDPVADFTYMTDFVPLN